MVFVAAFQVIGFAAMCAPVRLAFHVKANNTMRNNAHHHVCNGVHIRCVSEFKKGARRGAHLYKLPQACAFSQAWLAFNGKMRYKMHIKCVTIGVQNGVHPVHTVMHHPTRVHSSFC